MSSSQGQNTATHEPALARATGLGRPVDPRVTSNLLAIVGTAAAWIVVTIRDLIGPGTVDWTNVLAAGLAVFLAWAIGRELDPDQPRSATLGMVATFTFVLFTGVEAAAAAVALLGVRLIVGSVGRPLKAVDYMVLVAVAGFSGTRPELWGPGTLVVTGLLFFRPARFPAATLAATTAAVVGALAWGSPPTLSLDGPSLVAAAVGILSFLASVPVRDVTSRTDSGEVLISANRVALARVVTGVAIAITAFLSSVPVPVVAPILAPLASVAVVRAFTGEKPPQ